jgi:pimeloyl-ACP methyl ester carboxylesterase
MSTPDATSNEGLASTVREGQLTAENLSLEVAEVSFVYRRFGNAHTAAPALVMLQHFRGNLDSWDPALVDRLAQDRELVLVDNRGVGGSTGVVPETVTAMARDVLTFIDALDLKQIDLLGFSLGGYVAQELVLLRPRLVRRLVLAGTAPQGGPGPTPLERERVRAGDTGRAHRRRLAELVLLRLRAKSRQRHGGDRTPLPTGGRP